MNTVEFIKKFGWDAINHDLSGYFKGENIGKIQVLTKENEYIEVDGDDLKRFVESHELVESYGGLESAKMFVGSEYRKLSQPKTYNHLCEAISDVENCK